MINEKLIKEIVFATNVTKIIKKLNLSPEQRSTRVSLRNLKKIQNSPLGFKIKEVTFYLDRHPRLHTEWVSKDDALTWDFRGVKTFENLNQFLNIFGIKLNVDEIYNLKPGKYKFL
jgi:hypothetical protein